MMKFEKHSDFKVLEYEPFNGGAPAARLVEHYLTPTDLFFVRCHASIPLVDAAAYRLTVEGLVTTPLTLSLDDLRRDFERVRLVAVMQCAGNRRAELQKRAPIPDELIWDTEAIGSAEWGGWRLRDVLLAAGAPAADGDLHAAFEGLDAAAHGQPFGGSIPLAKALHGDVLLADTMNGAPLAPAHGFPLRVVVPGYIGARSVKWLARIVVQDAPSNNYYQARAYKLFAGDVTPETVDWSTGMMLGELNVNAIIAQIVPGAGGIIARGVAVAGERQVERVEVSADGGERWKQAALIDPPSRYGWRRWEARLALEAGEYEIIARAWDSAAATQPERIESVWNFKGYMNNAWHRVKVTVAE
jgi:sulfite oxidase